MAISSTSFKTTITTSGSTGPFTIPFLLNNSSELVVIQVSTANVESTYSSTKYSVTGSFPSSTGTFSITSTSDVLSSSNQKFLVKRIVPLIQSQSFPSAGALPAANIEKGLDNTIMAVQQLDETLTRSITLPAASTVTGLTVTPSSGQFIQWSTSNTFTNVTVVSSTSPAVSTLWQGILTDTASTKSLATLGALASTGTATAANQIAVYSATASVFMAPTLPTVSTAGQIGGHYGSVSTMSTSFTLSSSEAGKFLDMGSSTSCTITIPATTTTNLTKGFMVTTIRNTTNTVTFAVSTAGPDSLLSNSSKYFIANQFEVASLVKLAASSSTSNWSLAGSLSTS